MNSNWVHTSTTAYETERGRKALEVAKRMEQERIEKEKQLCQEK